MTEIQLQPPQHQDSAFQGPDEALLPEILESSAVIDGIEARGVAVENREAVTQALDTIRSEFGIADEAFNDTKASLLLVAVADNMTKVEDGTGSQGYDKAFIGDIVLAAAGKYSDHTEEARNLMNFEGTHVSDEGRKKTLEKFSHPELSRDMTDFIHGPQLEALRQRLGIETEEEFEVRVLTIDSGDIHGLVPNVNYDAIGSSEDLNSLVTEQDTRNAYKKGLEKRSASFAEELGREQVPAPAWITTFEDGSTPYLCVSSALAEKVMYPKEERAGYYTQDDYDHDVATVEHEFVHTQGMLNEGEIGPGITLEEMRAEHFSGSKLGYTDIKRLFSGVKMITGYNLADSFEIDGNSYNRDELLTDVARNLGLDGFLDVMLAMPTNYAQDEHASRFVKSVVAHTGGLSGIFGRIYNRTVKNEGMEMVQRRLSDSVDHLRDLFKDKEYITVESWFAYGGLELLRDIGIKNFRSRYPEESDNYDYTT